MRLAVCALADLAAEIDRHRPDAVVSLLAPGQAPPPVPSASRLVLSFHDIAEARPGLVAPTAADIDTLLDFAAALPERASLLLHCWMGISRSPAAAYAVACARAAPGAEDALARILRRAAPWATPNPRLIALADERLGRGGRMVQAVARIGRGAEAGVGRPFLLALARSASGRPDESA